MPLVSVISPQYVRSRDDKSWNLSDVRLGQITDLVPVAKTEISAGELVLANSEILQREVYTKTLRGQTLVRKFLLWKTNKDRESEEFPGFVAYYTDFSPTRKTPLTRDIRVTNSQSQAIALYRAFKEENLKKGWELNSRTGSLTSEIDKELDGRSTPRDS